MTPRKGSEATIHRAENLGRPYVFCHMEMSLDGKIMGAFWDVLNNLTDDPFFDIAFGSDRVWDHQGWVSGRITTDDNFTNYAKPELRESAPPVPPGDFIAGTDADIYYISVDPHGRLGWTSNEIDYKGVHARVIEVLTESASNAYKDFLRRLDIPYIICGTESVDFSSMLQKLQDQFGCTCLMLGGGATINWSMIQQGLCDELSIIIDPSADGSTKTQTLFMQADGLSTVKPIRFDLETIERVGTNDQQVWLRYTISATENQRLQQEAQTQQ